MAANSHDARHRPSFRSDFAQLPKEIMRELVAGKVRLSTLQVYGVLADCFGIDGAFPSRAEIRDRTGLSKKSITAAFADLQERGWAVNLGPLKRKNGSNTQVIVWDLPHDPRNSAKKAKAQTGEPGVTGEPEVSSPVTSGSRNRLPQVHPEQEPKNHNQEPIPPSPPKGEGWIFSDEDWEALLRSLSGTDRANLPEGHHRLATALKELSMTPGPKRRGFSLASAALVVLSRRDPLTGMRRPRGWLRSEARKRDAEKDEAEVQERIAEGRRRIEAAEREATEEANRPPPDPEFAKAALARAGKIANDAEPIPEPQFVKRKRRRSAS